MRTKRKRPARPADASLTARGAQGPASWSGMNAEAGSTLTGPQDKLVLRSSKRKAVFLLAASLVFIGLGFLMVTGAIAFPGLLNIAVKVVGWFAMVFFGLGVPVALFQLLTGKSYLLLTREGFEMRGIRKSRRIPWSEVSAFAAWTLVNPVLALLPRGIRDLGQPKMVMFDYGPGVESHRRLRSVNQMLAGHDAGLADTYGLTAEELAALMNDWRSRFAAS